jgi:hypothetical protein
LAWTHPLGFLVACSTVDHPSTFIFAAPVTASQFAVPVPEIAGCHSLQTYCHQETYKSICRAQGCLSGPLWYVGVGAPCTTSRCSIVITQT